MAIAIEITALMIAAGMETAAIIKSAKELMKGANRIIRGVVSDKPQAFARSIS